MIADKHEEAFSQVFDVIKQGNPGYITKIRTKLYVRRSLVYKTSAKDG